MTREPRPPKALRSLLSATLALALGSPVAAQWEVREVVDPRSGDAAEAPGVRSERGFGLDLLRDDGGGVLGVFRLPPGDPDFLDAAQPPVLRIDEGTSQTVLLREGGLTWAAFPLWSGQGQAATGLLRELMTGVTLEVSYSLHGGGYKTAALPLAGAAPLLAEVFGIPERITPEQQAAARELEAAIEREGSRCLELKGKRRERCLETARACIEAATTAEELAACIARGSG